jgi:membrane protease YdiL (CAAX protease family)
VAEARRASRRLESLQATLGWTLPARGTAGPAFAFALASGTGLAMLISTLTESSAPVGWRVVISLVLWQPLIEESLFRGVLQGELLRLPRLRQARLGLTGANVLSSLAFAAVHLVHQPLPWALATFAPSLVFGYFRDRCRSALPGLALHVAYNAGFFLVP